MSGKIIDVSDNLNYLDYKGAFRPIMQVYRNELYCAWHEYVGSSATTAQIKLKSYNGYRWNEASNNLNHNGGQYANSPRLQVYGNKLYCTWNETAMNQSYKEAKLKEYNWGFISTNLSYGNRDVSTPNMQVYKNELYCAWEEYNGSNDQIKMKKYDGKSLRYIYGQINYNEKCYARSPTMEVYKGELYCIWSENNTNNHKFQIKIKKYNGNTWTNVSNNLNYNDSSDAYAPVMQVYKNELYCAWREWSTDNSNYQIKIKKYNGDTWTNISNNLNHYGHHNAYWPKMQVYKDELYCIWDQDNDSSSSSSKIIKIVLKKYDGANWTLISDNLNYNKRCNAGSPAMQVYKDELYCAWYEGTINDKNTQIKMKKYISITKKYLIKYNERYFKINTDKEIVEVENSNFKTNGFNNIELITRELLENKFGNLNNIQILMWTDDIDKNEAIMTCELRNPYRPIDILKKNNNGICNILFKEL